MPPSYHQGNDSDRCGQIHARLIAANIRARRRALNVTQQQLSHAIGYEDNGKFFSRVESEGQSVPAEYLPAIAQRLGIDDWRKFYQENAFT